MGLFIFTQELSRPEIVATPNTTKPLKPFSHLEIESRENTWQLSNARCIYWVERETLLLADLHIGKGRHFRRQGIAVPQQSDDNDLKRLRKTIDQYQPGRVMLLGDVFHSDDVADDEGFELMLHDTRGVEWVLITGNHDPKGLHRYEHLPLQAFENSYQLDGFNFTHHPEPVVDKLTFCGHVHPSVSMYGKGLQSLKLPCFHWRKDLVVLPAFSHFTGKGAVQTKSSDRVFVVTGDEVIEANGVAI